MPQSNERSHVSGEAAILARRYAGAFYELAEEDKNLDAIAADLRTLRQATGGNADFVSLAKNPRLTRGQLVQAAGAVAEHLKLNPLTGKFLALVARHRRLVLLPAIIQAFLARLAASRGEITASVHAAAPLTPQQSEILAQRLAALAGGKVHIDLREDKSLIGGFTVRLGSRLIDASVKSKLERLERRLKAEAA